jgi:hypothetical protein
MLILFCNTKFPRHSAFYQRGEFFSRKKEVVGGENPFISMNNLLCASAARSRETSGSGTYGIGVVKCL